jgi:hypothetical protein
MVATSYKFILLHENVDLCQAVSWADNRKECLQSPLLQDSVCDFERFKKCNL